MTEDRQTDEQTYRETQQQADSDTNTTTTLCGEYYACASFYFTSFTVSLLACRRCLPLIDFCCLSSAAFVLSPQNSAWAHSALQFYCFHYNFLCFRKSSVQVCCCCCCGHFACAPLKLSHCLLFGAVNASLWMLSELLRCACNSSPLSKVAHWLAFAGL